MSRWKDPRILSLAAFIVITVISIIILYVTNPKNPYQKRSDKEIVVKSLLAGNVAAIIVFLLFISSKTKTVLVECSNDHEVVKDILQDIEMPTVLYSPDYYSCR